MDGAVRGDGPRAGRGDGFLAFLGAVGAGGVATTRTQSGPLPELRGLPTVGIDGVTLDRDGGRFELSAVDGSWMLNGDDAAAAVTAWRAFGKTRQPLIGARSRCFSQPACCVSGSVLRKVPGHWLGETPA